MEHARRYAIVGVNELGFQLAHNIKNSEELGLEFVGFYDDRPADRVAAIPLGVGDCVGKIEDMVEHACRRNVDMIYAVTFPMRAEQRIKRILDQLSDTGLGLRGPRFLRFRTAPLAHGPTSTVCRW